MTCLCVCVCVWERARSSCGFVFQNAPQSTAVQKDEAPKHELYYIAHNAVQGSRWYLLTQRWKWEESSWFECFPMIFYFYLEFNSLLSQKGKGNGTLFQCWKALLWHFVTTASGSTQLYLSVSAGKTAAVTDFTTEWKGKVQEGREGTVREYRWKSPRKICNVYNVIIYDAVRWQLISCQLLVKDSEEVYIQSYGFTRITAMAIIYVLFIVLLIGFIFNFFYCYYIILEKKYIVIS